MRATLLVWLIGSLSWGAELAARGDWEGGFHRITIECVVFAAIMVLSSWQLRRVISAIVRRFEGRDAREVDLAWGIIANVDNGDWKQSKEWTVTANAWRDRNLDRDFR